LIRKPQFYVFVKYLNLTKFKNVFGLNLNFEFKFKTAEKNLQNISIFSLVAQLLSAQVPLQSNPSLI
jgi:hypothetical protein